jgi:exportin-T
MQNMNNSCRISFIFFQGDEFVNYLHAEYLPTLQISPQLIDEYCQALKAENKVFKNYVKVSGRIDMLS